ncbi:DUF887-domain-containing protein [Phellopilus nigrolimitatus]|nr:DUF887-domain-containing protein [Phellopilus nigrolimitatus]
MADTLDVVRLLLEDVSRPLAHGLGLTKLPAHFPILVGSAVFFWAVHIAVAPALSSAFFPGSYGRLKTARDRNNWNIRVVSLVHALVIIPLALRSLDFPALNADRVFGWDPRVGTLTGIACGYFLWDTLESVIHLSEIGFVVHGLACFFIFSLSFKPFIAYYVPRFLLWELSTPFLNIHWFLDKMGRTGSTLQLINGLCLLGTFAGVRLVYGSIQSYAFYQTLFVNKDDIAFIMILTYGVGNVILNGLNVIWFRKMVIALRKRMESSAKASEKRE